MTCIVAINDGRKVWMGGDSAATRGTERIILGNPKVWGQGPYIYGLAGNPTISQRMRQSFHPTIHSSDPFAHISGEWVDQLRDLTIDHELGDELGLPAQMLIGYKGKIFELCQNYLVMEAGKDYASVGSGSVYALGSLTRTHGNPERRIIQALEAACEHDSGCAPPFHIICGGKK